MIRRFGCRYLLLFAAWDLMALRNVEDIIQARDEPGRSPGTPVAGRASRPNSGRRAGVGTFMVKNFLRIRDRHQRDFCFGPTHEEVITDLVRHEGPFISSAAS